MQYTKISNFNYINLLFESVLNFVIFLSGRQNTFYNQLLRKRRSCENNKIRCWNFFLTLLINSSSIIHLKSLKEEKNVGKVIIYVTKKNTRL